jgi:hypothetical protein
MSSLNGGPVKEFCVSVTFLEPLDARCFLPESLFLGFPCLQPLINICLLDFKIFRKTLLPDLSLCHAHLFCQLLLGVKDVAKGLPIPESKLLLKVLEPLLESIHFGAMGYLCLSPPSLDLIVKIWVAEPELLESEGFLT